MKQTDSIKFESGWYHDVSIENKNDMLIYTDLH